jgi:hypothetical protein
VSKLFLYYFYMLNVQSFQQSLLKILSSTLCCLYSFIKDQLTLFLSSLFFHQYHITLVFWEGVFLCLAVLITITLLLILTLSSNFFYIVLGNPDHIHLHINFRISVSRVNMIEVFHTFVSK